MRKVNFSEALQESLQKDKVPEIFVNRKTDRKDENER
jgi:hypothetical protein